MLEADDSPIVFYQYFDTTDTAYFQKAVRASFLAGGHRRPIDFRIWNCYDQPPCLDGDVYSYDAVALNALASRGLLRQIPKIIDTDGIFEWMMDTTRYERKLFALPFITCFTAIICHASDAKGINNVYDIKGRMVSPLKSMMAYYYLMSFCNYQDRVAGRFSADHLSAHALAVVNLLSELMGGRAELDRSRLSSFDGVRRFNQGTVPYFLGFTENLRSMDRDSYAVMYANFTDHSLTEVPLFPTDVLSLGRRPTGAKLLDCIDLIELIVSAPFQQDICAPAGHLSYMLPANRKAYPGLIAADPLYKRLLEIVSDPDNCVMRFNKGYYEQFPAMEQALLKALDG